MKGEPKEEVLEPHSYFAFPCSYLEAEKIILQYGKVRTTIDFDRLSELSGGMMITVETDRKYNIRRFFTVEPEDTEMGELPLIIEKTRLNDNFGDEGVIFSLGYLGRKLDQARAGDLKLEPIDIEKD